MGMTTSLRKRILISVAAAAAAAAFSLIPAAPALADGPPPTPLGTWVQAEEWCVSFNIGGGLTEFCGWQCPDLSANIIAVDVFDGVRYCLIGRYYAPHPTLDPISTHLS